MPLLGSCEIGIVSPVYGMLERKALLPKGPNSGHIITGCLGNCKKLVFSKIVMNVLIIKNIISKGNFKALTS